MSTQNNQLKQLNCVESFKWH